ncbi:hypothetical protein [Mycobacterium sp.]|nr:hypothetical protein [Mycobacterium sp.]
MSTQLFIILVGVIAVFVACLIIVVALCAAAARGDRMMDDEQ